MSLQVFQPTRNGKWHAVSLTRTTTRGNPVSLCGWPSRGARVSVGPEVDCLQCLAKIKKQEATQ